jgi:hypothetical protein
MCGAGRALPGNRSSMGAAPGAPAEWAGYDDGGVRAACSP